jgi:hypothetical protein
VLLTINIMIVAILCKWHFSARELTLDFNQPCAHQIIADRSAAVSAFSRGSLAAWRTVSTIARCELDLAESAHVI